MTIYQEEMQRKAQHYGCITSYDEADQLLLISHKGVHLTAINPEGFMFYNSKDLTDPESREVFSHLTDDTLNADRKHNSNDRGQSFGNSGNGKRNGGHKDLKHRNTVYKTYDKDNTAGGKGYDAEIFAELCQLLLQRCLTVLFIIKKICDLTHLGVHTGSSNNGSRRTVCDGAAGINHIVTVAERCAILYNGLVILFGRHRFTRKCRFFGFKSRTVQKSCIGRNEIAGFQTDNITGNELGGISCSSVPVRNSLKTTSLTTRLLPLPVLSAFPNLTEFTVKRLLSLTMKRMRF